MELSVAQEESILVYDTFDQWLRRIILGKSFPITRRRAFFLRVLSIHACLLLSLSVRLTIAVVAYCVMLTIGGCIPISQTRFN